MSSYSPNIDNVPQGNDSKYHCLEVTAGSTPGEVHLLPDFCVYKNELVISWLCFYVDFYLAKKDLND